MARRSFIKKIKLIEQGRRGHPGPAGGTALPAHWMYKEAKQESSDHGTYDEAPHFGGSVLLVQAFPGKDVNDQKCRYFYNELYKLFVASLSWCFHIAKLRYFFIPSHPFLKAGRVQRCPAL